MGRAISIDQLFNTRRKYIPLEGEWLMRLGKPEIGARWFVMAPTGSGKSTFVSMLSKELSKYGRVGYCSAEEGDSESLKMAFKRVDMKDVKGKVIVYDHSDVESLTEDLKKHKSPSIIVIDTVQFFEMTKKQYKELIKAFPNKTFIWISHMDGKNPDGKLAEHIWRDSAIKINIEGFVAFIRSSRYGGDWRPVMIWEEGAKKYHGPDFFNIG